MDYPLNTLGLSHKFMAEHIKSGDFVIDATAGKGRDTCFLASLVGKNGRVLAFDIQEDAVIQTKTLVKEQGYEDIVTVILDSHSNMDNYADENSVSAIMFNFGWLPGGDHNIFSTPKTSIPAIEKGLKLLKSGGVMSLCIYHGKECGTYDRDAIMEYLKTVDNKRYTVVVADFYNRTGEIPIPVFIYKD